jgi:hypothetical protein
MPTPLDIDKQLDDAIWAALEGNTIFTGANGVKAGSRVKAYIADADPKKKLRGAPAEWPTCSVTVTPTDLNRNAQRTFAMNSPAFSSSTCNVPVPFTQQAVILLTYDNGWDFSRRTPLESAIRQALMTTPNLGLAGVAGSFTTTAREPVRPQGEAANQTRPFTRITLTINRRMMLTQLV